MQFKYSSVFNKIVDLLPFVAGFIFIFIIGIVYAFLRPEGLLLNGFFLLMVIAWVIYIIKLLWETIDRISKQKQGGEMVDIDIEQPVSEKNKQKSWFIPVPSG